jgi:hypothetical protein
MLDNLFKITQLTLPVATIIGSAWVMSSGNNFGAVALFIGGAIFTIALRFIEQSIFETDCYNGNIRHKR